MKASSFILCSGLLCVCKGTSLAASVITETVPPPPQYTVTDLGSLGWVAAIGTGINATGQISGYVSNSVRVHLTGYRAAKWTSTPGQIIFDLSGIGSFESYFGYDSQAHDINDAGQLAGASRIVGAPNPSDNPYHAVRWNGVTPTDLGTLGGTESFGLAINASGQVAGYSQIAGNAAYRAVVWTGTTATALGTLGGTNSEAWDINDIGQVVGSSSLPDNVNRHAVRWTGTTPTDLGIGDARGINNAGQVIGTMGNHATIWTGTTPTDLGTLGGSSSEGLDINAFGVAVGMSFTTGNLSNEPFISIDGMMYNLNTLLAPNSNLFSLRVTGINDRGQIVGYGNIGGGQHAVRLNPVTPVPEPATGLLMLGSAAMLFLRRRARG